MLPPKAADTDLLGRFREVISDPLNLLIARVPKAGIVEGNEVYLHNGNRVPLSGAGAYYGAFSQILVINRGVHEPLEEYVFQEAIKSLPASPLMIELGAYWAHYSMWLKKVRPTATTIMVEPDPANLAAGRANFSRNGFEGEFIQATVAAGQWTLDSFYPVPQHFTHRHPACGYPRLRSGIYAWSTRNAEQSNRRLFVRVDAFPVAASAHRERIC